MVGSRYAMYMGALLLVVGAVFVFVHGLSQVVPAEEDALDYETTFDDEPDMEDDEAGIEVEAALATH